MYCLWENGVYLLYNAHLNKIVFCKCCGDNDQILKSFSIEEFKKIEDINSEIHSLEGIIPENFSPKSLGGTCWPHSKCDISVFNKENVISKVGVSLDRVCNAKCPFCLVDEYDKSLSKELSDLYFSTLDRLKSGNWGQIRLTDRGEPGVFKGPTLNWLKSISTSDTKCVSVTTNGSFLHSEIIEVMKQKKQEGMTFDCIVSLNGVNTESRYKAMGLSDFDDIYNKIKYLDEIKLFDYFAISMVVTYDNISEIKNFIKLFKTNTCRVLIPFNLDTPEIADLPEYKEALQLI